MSCSAATAVNVAGSTSSSAATSATKRSKPAGRLEGDPPARTLEIVEPGGRQMPAVSAMAEATRTAGKSVAAARA